MPATATAVAACSECVLTLHQSHWRLCTVRHRRTSFQVQDCSRESRVFAFCAPFLSAPLQIELVFCDHLFCAYQRSNYMKPHAYSQLNRNHAFIGSALRTCWRCCFCSTFNWLCVRIFILLVWFESFEFAAAKIESVWAHSFVSFNWNNFFKSEIWTDMTSATPTRSCGNKDTVDWTV